MGCYPSTNTNHAAILRELRDIRGEMTERLAALERRATHVLDEVTERLLHNGALFYLLDPTGYPACCGFFVGSCIALTVAHGLLRVSSSATICAVSSRRNTPDQLRFVVVSKDDALDFAVLRLVHSARAVPTAFFAMSQSVADCSPGRKLAIVSMSLGGRMLPREVTPSPPTLGVDAVVIKRVDHNDIVYDLSTWCGDSGSVVAVENGVALAMHLGVVSELSNAQQLCSLPSVRHVMSRATIHDSASFVSRSDHSWVTREMSKATDAAVKAAGSLGKEGKALLLSNTTVIAAVASAVGGADRARLPGTSLDSIAVFSSNPLRGMAAGSSTGTSHVAALGSQLHWQHSSFGVGRLRRRACSL